MLGAKSERKDESPVERLKLWDQKSSFGTLRDLGQRIREVFFEVCTYDMFGFVLRVQSVRCLFDATMVPTWALCGQLVIVFVADKAW